jgi:hypothetical protein
MKKKDFMKDVSGNRKVESSNLFRPIPFSHVPVLALRAKICRFALQNEHLPAHFCFFPNQSASL